MLPGLAISGLYGSGAMFVAATSAGSTVHVWPTGVGTSTTTNTSSIYYGTRKLLLYGLYVVNASGGTVNVGPGDVTAGAFLASNTLRFSCANGYKGWIPFGPEGLLVSQADANVALRIAASTGLYAALVMKPL